MKIDYLWSGFAKKRISYFQHEHSDSGDIKKEGGNAQAVCRRERYAYFAEMMKQHKINKLVTAHHADDQLETMLMALTRSGSVGGFKGISSKRTFAAGTIIRPFLTVTKEEIRKYLEGQGGTFREDASNLKDDYTRNRFRHHIVPLLKKRTLKLRFMRFNCPKVCSKMTNI